MRPEFDVHLLNPKGLDKATRLGELFSSLLDNVEQICGSLNNGRELAIVRTKLEEASYYAKRAVALNPAHRADKETP